jgi:hypothetical protein
LEQRKADWHGLCSNPTRFKKLNNNIRETTTNPTLNMKKPITILARTVAVASLAFLAQNAQSQIGTGNLYQDSTTTQNGNFNNGNNTEGNEISLAGTATHDLITSFSFQYDFTGAGTPNPNAVTADVQFFANTGAPVSGYASPGGSPLFDSGAFSIGGYTTGSTANFYQVDLGGGVVVPQIFTWVVTFAGLTNGQNAGLALYSPATVGHNFDDAWINDGGGWQLDVATRGNPPLDFGAVFNGTPQAPDSTSLSFSVLAVLAGFGWMKRFQRKA